MNELLRLILKPLAQTLYMTLAASLFSLLLGGGLGMILLITDKSGLWPHPMLNKILGTLINTLRSFPFIILMILVFPLAKLLVGTRIGTTAAIVPLSISAFPFVARVMESALREVPFGVIEAAKAMGSSTGKILFKVLLPEALPGIVSGITLVVISLLGYSAMAGAIGAGGLGDLAIRYGYQRYQTDVMVASVVVLMVLVQGIQWVGDYFSLKIIKKRSK